MSYGELNLGPEWSGTDKQTGRFQKGHVPANKGKRWNEWMSKCGQASAAKNGKRLGEYVRQHGRSEKAGIPKKQVVAVLPDGSWTVFAYSQPAAEWVGGNRENVRRCCNLNQSRKRLKKQWGHPSDKVNTDHKYKGVRFYFVDDDTWTTKIKKT